MLAYNGHIEKQTLENTSFRGMSSNGERVPAVVMCLEPEEEIGDEVRLDADRFIRIEQGEATLVLNMGEGQPARVNNFETPGIGI
jgi:hypothetical protein